MFMRNKTLPAGLLIIVNRKYEKSKWTRVCVTGVYEELERIAGYFAPNSSLLFSSVKDKEFRRLSKTADRMGKDALDFLEPIGKRLMK